MWIVKGNIESLSNYERIINKRITSFAYADLGDIGAHLKFSSNDLFALCGNHSALDLNSASAVTINTISNYINHRDVILRPQASVLLNETHAMQIYLAQPTETTKFTRPISFVGIIQLPLSLQVASMSGLYIEREKNIGFHITRLIPLPIDTEARGLAVVRAAGVSPRFSFAYVTTMSRHLPDPDMNRPVSHGVPLLYVLSATDVGIIDTVKIPFMDVGKVTAHYVESITSTAVKSSRRKTVMAGSNPGSAAPLTVRLHVFSYRGDEVQNIDLQMGAVQGISLIRSSHRYELKCDPDTQKIVSAWRWDSLIRQSEPAINKAYSQRYSSTQQQEQTNPLDSDKQSTAETEEENSLKSTDQEMPAGIEDDELSVSLSLANSLQALDEESYVSRSDKLFIDVQQSGYSSFSLGPRGGIYAVAHAHPLIVKFPDPDFFTASHGGDSKDEFLQSIFDTPLSEAKRIFGMKSEAVLASRIMSKPWTCTAWWDLRDVIGESATRDWPNLSPEEQGAVLTILAPPRSSELETLTLIPSKNGDDDSKFGLNKNNRRRLQSLSHSDDVVTGDVGTNESYVSFTDSMQNVLLNHGKTISTTVSNLFDLTSMMSSIDEAIGENGLISKEKSASPLVTSATPTTSHYRVVHSQNAIPPKNSSPLSIPFPAAVDYFNLLNQIHRFKNLYSRESRSRRLSRDPSKSSLHKMLNYKHSIHASFRSKNFLQSLTGFSIFTSNSLRRALVESRTSDRIPVNDPSFSMRNSKVNTVSRVLLFIQNSEGAAYREIWLSEGFGGDTRPSPIATAQKLSRKERQQLLSQNQLVALSNEDEKDLEVSSNLQKSEHSTEMKSQTLHYVSVICGILYVCLWAGGSYPQIWLNWERKSCYGFSFDKSLFNTVGYNCYFLYTVISYTIQHLYGLPKAIEGADLFFATNCIIVLIIIESQIRLYSKPGDGDYCNRALAARIICLFFFALIPFTSSLATAQVIPWTSIEKPFIPPPTFMADESLPYLLPVTKGGPLVSGGFAFPLTASGSIGISSAFPSISGFGFLGSLWGLSEKGNGLSLGDDTETVNEAFKNLQLPVNMFDINYLSDTDNEAAIKMRRLKNEKVGMKSELTEVLVADLIPSLPPRPQSIQSSHGKGEVSLVGGLGRVTNKISVLSTLGYIKVACTFIKYIPQINLNIQRQSTRGMSALHLVSDLLGAFFAIMQNVVDAYNFDDMTFITGNIPKIAISVTSAVFCLILTIQHIFIYGPVTPLEEREDMLMRKQIRRHSKVVTEPAYYALNSKLNSSSGPHKPSLKRNRKIPSSETGGLFPMHNSMPLFQVIKTSTRSNQDTSGDSGFLHNETSALTPLLINGVTSQPKHLQETQNHNAALNLSSQSSSNAKNPKSPKGDDLIFGPFLEDRVVVGTNGVINVLGPVPGGRRPFSSK